MLRRTLGNETRRLAATSRGTRGDKEKMMRKTLAAWALGILAVLPGSVLAGDFSKIFAEHENSVVTIRVKSGAGIAQGSGFFIAENMIATNLHVIKGAKAVQYARHYRDGFLDVDMLVALDKKKDLAILYAKEGGVPLELASPESLVPGAEIGVIGSPRGFEKSVTSGNFNNLRMFSGIEVVQFSAPVSPGNSGGPVFDEAGRVIGVVTFGMKSHVAQNMNFAISANYLLNMLEKAKNLTPDQYLSLQSAWGPSVAEATEAVTAWIDEKGVFHATNMPPTAEEPENPPKEQDIRKAPVSFMWKQ
jgi:S1-C subfamily serine protease